MLVKAIRTGCAIAEENVLLSLSAKDAYATDAYSALDRCTNGAIPNKSRARQLRQGWVWLEGRVEVFSAANIDETTAAVGGGTVLLKMVDMARNTEELVACLSMLRDVIKDNWAGSEEMERIRES